jgi:S-adenosylmethionine:tRNA ribosyltransferase-isomerase
MHPKNIAIQDFSYELPDDCIAKYPMAQRDESRLLINKEDQFTEDIYFHLDQHLPSDALLVFNNTRVVEARLHFKKSTGSTIELFCLEPADTYADITTAMLQKQRVLWKCLVGGAKKWKEESLVLPITVDGTTITLKATKQEKFPDSFLILFEWTDAALSFAEILHHAGVIPLPPYLNRTAEEKDKETYQTIYAKHDGSVAAPTAGLHFTDRLFKKLAAKNIHTGFVTLHVGAGTFKPVKSNTLEQHEMHTEFIEVTELFIQQLIQHLAGTIIPVGTTSLRTIESLYWLGVKVILQPAIMPADLQLYQWDAYELPHNNINATTALQALLQWMQAHNMPQLITKTQIIIAPGYSLKIASALITNFHQPQSTLLLLIAAFNSNWKKMYAYALAQGFRFLSYGDGCLIWKHKI